MAPGIIHYFNIFSSWVYNAFVATGFFHWEYGCTGLIFQLCMNNPKGCLRQKDPSREYFVFMTFCVVQIYLLAEVTNDIKVYANPSDTRTLWSLIPGHSLLPVVEATTFGEVQAPTTTTSVTAVSITKTVPDGPLGARLPVSLVLQHLISRAPSEIPSSYATAGWSIQQYLIWQLGPCNLQQRFQASPNFPITTTVTNRAGGESSIETKRQGRGASEAERLIFLRNGLAAYTKEASCELFLIL
ncbi:unnamed protein product [Protopolystoma xenopodis]|uniref:Uncharacterized protein n=1 Tax=Protopolystoma xenopodis TaxID=117903 RepID=A0A448WJ54_9PLAT|nr:unnamed protein product [Protopolystoma xenopodis]